MPDSVKDPLGLWIIDPVISPRGRTVEAQIENTCKALAPFMLALTSLGLEDLSQIEEVDGLEAATG